jgi:hypothetical protein
VPIADRIPELDLDQQSVEWRTLDDGSDGAYFANAGEDLHAVGSLAPIIDGYIGCIVIKPDGSRYVARSARDLLAQPPD